MSADKLVDSTQLDADLTSVANAIRTKGGTSASLAFPAGFVSAIGNIPSGGGGGISVLNTITISQDVNAIKVDFDPTWADLDFILVEIDAKQTAGDWFYFGYNTTSPGGYWAGADSSHWGAALSTKSGSAWTSRWQNNQGKKSTFSGFPNYMYMKCYTASKYFTTGTVITVYGGNYSS